MEGSSPAALRPPTAPARGFVLVIGEGELAWACARLLASGGLDGALLDGPPARVEADVLVVVFEPGEPPSSPIP